MSRDESPQTTPHRHDSLSFPSDLSQVDRDVIRILQVDGRTPIAQVSREIGITQKTARKRVQKLVARNVIQITTVTDPELLGYRAIALVAVRLDNRRPPAEVASDLAGIGAVDYVVVTTGRYHLLVEVMCTDLVELAATVEEEIMTVAGVVDREIFPYLRLQYQEPRFEAARWKSPDRVGVTPADELDAVDRQILAELNADGRIPFQVMARELSVSESQIRRRVNRMVNTGTVRILAITNPRSLGLHTIAWLGLVAAPGVHTEKLAAQISTLLSITYVVVCAGRFDIFAEAICVDQRDLLAVLDRQVRELPGVARVEAFVSFDLRYKRVVPSRGGAEAG
ncbi:MAG: Lrp/AsnC family transcriptional regulator [Solirubrobacterales bacterium]